ncbi:AGAP007999-PA-like protein [Anopheles sinensis]|uniref:AGAP007999-PA-like protein n=1 Tax=Anopheles sinensis TaxID=74873 RepID=A0A084WD82_ANOSI|nr:AGAP007999-PA-like protein [Anopheles sinensis]
MGEPTVSLESLELSGNILDRHDIADASAPGLLEVTGVSQTGTPTVSGLNDFDYQQLTALSMGLKDLNQLSTVNKVPIPPEIMEHFNHIKCHCTMGLFPEIGRAWLTIDTDLYIWTYENVRDVAYFDGLSEVIISVGLVAPKPGVFVSDVRYLLVLTTPVEIVILGVTFKDANNGTPNRSLSSQSTEEMQLMSGPIFLLNTDQVAIMCVQGTDDGRIFLGGRDGCLYEIVYQAETNWFGKRCRKVNHSQGLISHLVPGLFKMFTEVDSVKSIVVDNSRRLLYVLLSKGSIETWDIGTDAGSTRRIARLSHKEIFANATAILRTLNTNTFLPVSAICPLTADDSSSLHLVAVTENGVRLYFSTLPLNMHGFYLQHQQQQQQQQQQQMQQSQMENLQQTSPGQQPVPTLLFGQDQLGSRKPQGLYMLHVRVPPGYTPNTTTGKPTHVHTLHVTQGSVLMVSTPQQDQDFLWSLSTEQFQSQQNFIESATVMPLDGQVWAVGELKRKDRLSITTPLRTAQYPRKVALLTNQGVHIVCLQRSVDVLQQLLLACRGPNNDAVKAYFQIQTEAQACATALLLACLESYRGTEVGEWAAQAFVLYGGEPYFDTFLPNAGTTAQRQLAFNSPVAGGGYGSGGGYDGGSQQSGNFGPGPGRMWASTPFSTPGGGGRGPLLGYQQNLPQLPSDGGGSPNQSFNNNNNVSMGPHVVDSAHFHYSAKHTALYLHVSRMMRCVWNRPCINERFQSTILQADCATLLEDLYALRRFLETVPLCSTLGYVGGRNGTSVRATLGSSSFAPSGQANQSGLLLQSPLSNGNERGYGGASGLFSQPFATSSGGAGYVPSTAGVSQRTCTEEALQEEKKSLDALARLIKQSCEVIGLWKVICEHQCHQLVEKLAKEEQNLLKMCTFRDLIISRADVCGRLIVTLINTYLADNASVGPISSKLREVCPTLYRHEDAVSHKATEILLLTRSCTDREKKEERLRTALQLCKSAVPNLPLGELCAQFSACGFYAGVIELCTVCAAKSDPNEAALHFYRNNEPMDNQEGFIAYQNRSKCYREVKAMLDYMYESGAPASGRSSEAGDLAYPQMEQHQADDRSTDGRGNRAEIQGVIGQALQHTDQLLHIAIYEWLLSKGLHSEMLEITEPSLGVFLSRAMTRTPENMQLADLLWKYHERNGQHASAAKILDRLANSPGDSIDLLRRIEYLARAVMCMRSESVGFSAHNGVLLKDLEDKLEVAQIQRQVYDALALLAPSNDGTSRYTRDALHQLDTNLYNLTQLYSDFAEQYELWECKLTILNCSHHNDPLLIESVWTHILDRELSGPEDTAECCRRMLAKVKSLALEYDSSGCCFPLAFIVRELEIRCFRLGLFNSPVPEALLEMNLDVEELINIYSRLVSMNERIWMTDRDELYLIRSTTNLLSLIAAQPSLVPLKNRRKVLGKSQELSTAALNILYTKPDTESMIDSLRDTQSKLQRLL